MGHVRAMYQSSWESIKALQARQAPAAPSPSSSPPSQGSAPASVLAQCPARAGPSLLARQAAGEALTSHPPALWHTAGREVTSCGPLTLRVQLTLATGRLSKGRQNGAPHGHYPAPQRPKAPSWAGSSAQQTLCYVATQKLFKNPTIHGQRGGGDPARRENCHRFCHPAPSVPRQGPATSRGSAAHSADPQGPARPFCLPGLKGLSRLRAQRNLLHRPHRRLQ